MDKPTSDDGLSPLDQIRLAEAEITRKVAAAREAVESHAANARAQSAQIKKQAEEAGEREGQIHYKEMIAKAEEQAKLIVAQAQNEADDLRHKGQSRMEQAIHEVLNIILGAKTGGEIS